MLCAEECYKRIARRMQLARFSGAGIAAAAGVLAALGDRGSSAAAILGVVITVIVLVADRIERALIVTAGSVKDRFDAELFGISPSATNRSTPSHEEIVHRAASVSGRRNDLLNWYPDATGVPIGFGRLLCQRASVVWDYRLRVRTGWLLLTASGLVIAGALTYGIATDESLVTFLVAWVAPLSALVLVLAQGGWRNLETGRERKQLLDLIEDVWRVHVELGDDIPESQTRAIQEAIYRVRCSGPVIPRILQWRLDPGFRSEMSLASDRLKSSAPIAGN
jgi:hypothetical protein